MIKAITGLPALLQLQLFDGATDRHPRAYVRNSGGVLVFTVDLSHVGLGLYEGFFTPVIVDYYTSTFITFEDAGHTVEDNYYEHAIDIYGAEAPPVPFPTAGDIADAVWDEPMLDHSIPGSFGIHFQVIRQFSEVTNYEIVSGVNNLGNIMLNISNQGVLDRIEINQNEVKIDAIIPAIVAARNMVIAEVDQNEILINNLANQLTTTENDLTNEILVNRNKLDQIIVGINALSNNTTVRFVVPEQLMKPLTGTTTYQFHLRLYDEVGNPEAPDSTPTIRIRDLNTGTDVVLDVPMTQDGVKVGAYYFDFSISTGSLLHHYLVEAAIIENGVTRYVPAVTEVTEYQSDLEAIQLQLNDVDTKVTISKNMLENPIYGLQAITNDIADVNANVDVVEGKVDILNTKCDNLPNILATKTDVTDIKNTILTRPTLVQIQAALELVRQQIMGPDNRDNTEVYDKIDFSGLLQSNDPRLNYLDAYISSRSTLTAAQVWTYATRTLTSITIPISEFEKVWDVLTSQITVPNSIGQFILNMLDAPVSTRATAAQVQALLVGVAQESSVQQALTLIAQDITNGAICCANLTALLNAVKFKTDLLPPNPASEQNIDTAETNLTALMNSLGLIVTAIKVYTDRIPVDPAHESTVSGIPHNPVLATDPRLAFLDVPVSTRATPINISGLATHADVVNSTSTIVGEINQNEVKLNTIITNLATKPNQTYFDNKFITLATSAQLTSVRNDILNAISPGITAADVWNYVTRTLTTPFPDISNLATKSDIKPQYSSKFSTVYRDATSDQELIVWGEKNGERVADSSNCSVVVKDSNGAALWSASVSSPNADGMYRYIHNIAVTENSNYYIVITMTIEGQPRTTQQAFFTLF